VDCPCTPGKDCACTPGVNCPAKAPQRSDFCTPGVNCPCSGGNCNHCTPGVNCPCTPYIDCPDNDGVLFDTDSAEVRADTREKLVKFATEYKKNTQLVVVSDQELAGLSARKQEEAKQRDTRIRVEGHVSEDEMGGQPAAQVRLAMQRAAAVKKALIEAGLPEEFIAKTRGYGASCRISFRAEESQKNRAVQFVFERDRTGCAFDEIKLRPPPIPLPPPKKGQKGGAGAKGPAAKGGAAAQKPAGTK
jgi:outer membrane protein OmpA-like peptidoglycan-associated protein